jgi:hypothetical protein
MICYAKTLPFTGKCLHLFVKSHVTRVALQTAVAVGLLSRATGFESRPCYHLFRETAFVIFLTLFKWLSVSTIKDTQTVSFQAHTWLLFVIIILSQSALCNSCMWIKVSDLSMHQDLTICWVLVQGCTNRVARSPQWLRFIRWRRMFVGLQYETWFMSTFWRLEFWGGA